MRFNLGSRESTHCFEDTWSAFSVPAFHRAIELLALIEYRIVPIRIPHGVEETVAEHALGQVGQ